ncbi:uncharacterized protein LOC128739361 [Sabethes cyaneus]|uniref:uncharacterized protein LOC128739361 n=1 Tax=Sabethes cyaneus TaxID=53552 RepID=UPI00237DE8EB|nr:uncharacterized protein LOC128739361 [Sabethes cyaneus]
MEAKSDEFRLRRDAFEVSSPVEVLNAVDGPVEVRMVNPADKVLYLKYNRQLMAFRRVEATGGWTIVDALYDAFPSAAPIGSSYPWEVLSDGRTVMLRVDRKFCLYQLVNDRFVSMNNCSPSDRYDQVFMGKFNRRGSESDVLVREGEQLKLLSLYSAASLWIVQNVPIPVQAGSAISIAPNFDESDLNVVLLRTMDGLHIFRMDDSSKFVQIASCEAIELNTESTTFDRIMFAKLSTNSTNKELLHFNPAGLDVYQLNETSKSYEHKYYSTDFSSYHNWDADYINTITARDLTNDGLDELLCTGPAGFQIYEVVTDRFGFYLQTVAISSKELTFRFGVLKKLLPKLDHQVQQAVILKENKLLTVEIKPTKSWYIPIPENKQQPASPPPEIPKIYRDTQYKRWVHEQLDLKQLLQPVNALTGKIELSLPLIQLDNPFGIHVVKHFLYHDVPDQQALGRGWSFPLDYISVDDRGSIFEENHRYVIVKENNQVPLSRQSNPDADYWEFKIENYDDLEFKYFTAGNRWEMLSKNTSITYFFGNYGTRNATQYRKADEARARPVSWFLSREEQQTGGFVDYEYHFLADADVQMSKITTDADASVEFKYTGQRMDQFKVKTPNYSQNISFTYSRLGETDEFLSGIDQDRHVIFDFQYDSDTKLLSKITFPNGLSSSLQYSKFEMNRLNHTVSRETLNVDDFSLSYGPDYSVLVDKSGDGRSIKVRVRDLLAGMHHIKATNDIEPLAIVVKDGDVSGTREIVAYQVLTLEDLFVVVVVTDEQDKVLICYHFVANKWIVGERELLTQQATVTASSEIIYVADQQFLTRISLDGDGKLQRQKDPNQLSQNFSIYASSFGTIMYDDSPTMKILYEHARLATATYYTVPCEPELIQLMQKVIDRFQLTPAARSALLHGLKLDMVQFYKHIVVIRTLEISNGVLIIRLVLHILDEKHQLQLKDNWRIYHGRIEDLQLDVQSKAGDQCRLGYKLNNNKYVAFVKECSGPSVTKIDAELAAAQYSIESSTESSVRKQQMYAVAVHTHNNKTEQLHTDILLAHPYAFDVSLLGMVVNGQGIHVAGKTVYFDGKTFHQKPPQAGQEMQLGEDYKIRKTDDPADTYKLYQGEQLVFETNTNDGQALRLSWPQYLLAQANVGARAGYIRMFNFPARRIFEFPAGERLSRVSNNLLVGTIDQQNKTVAFYPLQGIIQPEVVALRNQTLRLGSSSSGEQRVTVYEYAAEDIVPLEGGLVFRRCRMLPGGNSSRYGWYEHSFDTRERTSARALFDGDGQFVESIEPQREPERPGFNKTETLTDKSGQLPIVVVNPKTVESGEYLYHGFEAYERNEIGGKLRWTYSGQEFITELGDRFVRLTGEEARIRGTFTVDDHTHMFVFSCWMRLKRELRFGDSIDVIKAHLVNKTGRIVRTFTKAEVKQKIRDWSYVELRLAGEDLPSLHPTEAVVTLKPSQGSALDVDHVRFSPLNVDLQAHIYRAPFPIPVATLTNSGLLKQYLLDPNGNIVVHFSEQGSVTEFITYSKVHLKGIYPDKLPQVMEMKPHRLGEYVSLDESFAAHWIRDEPEFWNISGGQLKHTSELPHRVSRQLHTKCEVFAVRFLYNLESNDAGISLHTNDNLTNILCSSDTANCENIQTCGVTQNVPKSGEVVALVSRTHRAIWLEGYLAFEAENSAASAIEQFGLLITGKVTLSEMIALYDPSVKITYYNLLGLPVQTVVLHDAATVRVKEVLYDDLDRPVKITKWTKVPKQGGGRMFAYYQDFIVETEPNKMTGLVKQFNPNCGEFPYFRNNYANNPSSSRTQVFIPGEAYAFGDKYSRKYSQKSNCEFLDVLFPPSKGFNQEVEIKQNVTMHVTVWNSTGKKVAKYVQLFDVDQRLTTYEYVADRLVLELPPVYHRLADTFRRSEPFWEGRLSEEEKTLQTTWGTAYRYDDFGRMISKRTPDSGVQRYEYSTDGELRILMHLPNETTKNADKIIYLSYGPTGKIVKEAVIDPYYQTVIESLGDVLLSLMTKDYAAYYHGEFDPQPHIRHRSQQSIRRIGTDQMMESLLFNEHDQIVRKVHVVPALNTSYSIDYEYSGDKLTLIRYPIAVNGSFEVAYGYNLAGDMIQIGTPVLPELFASLRYNADGLTEDIHFEPDSEHSYRREFKYNEPGYLTTIKDPFIEENISYSESEGYGTLYPLITEGLISKTAFTAKWYDRSNPSMSKLLLQDIVAANVSETQTRTCIDSFLKLGYMCAEQHLQRSFYPNLDDSIADACRTNAFRRLIHEQSFPQRYGHLYNYDSHQQLIDAKYFQNKLEENLKPLTATSWDPILNVGSSKKVWNILTQEGFIINSCIDSGSCYGRPGPQSPLAASVPPFGPLHALLLNAIADRKTIAPVVFEEKCTGWSAGIDCGKLREQLLSQNFIGAHSRKTFNAINPALQNALKQFTSHLPEIVGILQKHFGTRLGQSPGDILSSQYDANGNHRTFYVGFDQYSFQYKPGTNQISSISKQQLDGVGPREQYTVEHDSEGSVTVATHKGIKRIEYDRLTNRPSRISMIDGRSILLQYDVRGERTFKQVLDKDGNVWTEKYYLRDLNGRVLVDMQMTFLTGSKPPDIQVTNYIYSQQGLIGFVRDGEFYSVFTDHEGSVRLVIKDGEVKASYDYHPYGHIFRKSEQDLRGRLCYLYTGQEWDEETGLYNFHSRLYDPEIGRFYQIDPQSQYASPYVYAGNNPVALVDPDGQFAFLLISIFLALVGAYLGGAAANGSWNPGEWNWASAGTWLGIIGGALGGGFMPSNMASTMTLLVGYGLSTSTAVSVMVGSGIGFSYFSMAAANNAWDPKDWDMKSPATWRGFFSGVATSSWILSNPSSLISTYGQISSATGKGLFIAGKIVLSGGFAYMYGVLAHNGEFDLTKWDFTKPALYVAFVDGVTFATTVTKLITNTPKNLFKLKQRIISVIDTLDESEAYVRYNLHANSDWSEKFSQLQYFIGANSEGIRMMSRGALTVSFFTIITSLRVTQAIAKSSVPEYSVMYSIISSVHTTRGFSNRIISNIIPVVTQPRAKRDISSSDRPETIPAATSSGSLFSSFLPKLFKTPFTTKFHKSDPTMDNKLSVLAPNLEDDHPRKTVYTVPNCYRFGESLIECYGQHEKLSIYFQPDNAARDHNLREADLHRCFPISFDNVPGVSCEGESTSVLFTAYHDQSKLFDWIDGWLLLMRVLPAAVNNLVSGIRYVFDKPKRRNPVVGEKELSYLRKKLQSLSGLINDDLHWSRTAYDNLLEDVDELIAEGGLDSGMLNLIEERIAALKADITEGLVLTDNKKFMDEATSNRKTGSPEIYFNGLQAVQTLSATDQLSMIHRVGLSL